MSSVLSYKVVEDTKHINAQARMCARQLLLYFSLGCETLPQVIQRNSSQCWPHTQAVLVPSISKPPAA